MFISNENRKILKIENDARTKSVSVKETYDGDIVVEGLPLASLYDVGYERVHKTFTITVTEDEGSGTTSLFENVYVPMMNSIEINGVAYENPTQQDWGDGYYSYGEPWVEGTYKWDLYDFAIDFAPDDETYLYTKHPGVYEITIDAIVKYADDPSPTSSSFDVEFIEDSSGIKFQSEFTVSELCDKLSRHETVTAVYKGNRGGVFDFSGPASIVAPCSLMATQGFDVIYFLFTFDYNKLTLKLYLQSGVPKVQEM